MTDGHYPETRIMLAVCDRFGVTLAELRSHSRNALLVRARHAAMWAIRHQTSLSYPQIGRLFDRHHTSVMHAVARIDGARRANHQLNQLLESIR